MVKRPFPAMRPANIIVSLLLVLAGMVWLGLIAIAPDMQSADPVGHSITCALTNAGLIALWALLAGAVLVAGISSRADLASGIVVGLLLLGSVAASLATVRVCAGMTAPAWMLVVVFAPPPIVACLAIAIHSQHLRQVAPPVLLNGLWCALIALALLPCPFVVREARLQSESTARVQPLSVVSSDNRPSIIRVDDSSAVLIASDRAMPRH